MSLRPGVIGVRDGDGRCRSLEADGGGGGPEKSLKKSSWA